MLTVYAFALCCYPSGNLLLLLLFENTSSERDSDQILKPEEGKDAWEAEKNRGKKCSWGKKGVSVP